LVEPRDRDRRVLHRERSSEPATRVGILQLDQLGAADVAQQAPWLALQAEVAQAVAGVVPREPSGKARPDVFDAQPVHEKRAQLVRALGDGLGARAPGGVL